jgi:DNA-binding winged helix-turn-helix (wHTH) protein/serine/threonine protein kinase
LEATDAAKGAAASPQARRWSFGGVTLDERTLELSVNGSLVSLERKPLEVLLCLLNRAGEVVTKDELLEAVWPGRILTETVLTKHVGRLREALDDDEQRIIKTQHGFGYRLIAPVQVETSTAPAPPHFSFGPGDHPPGRPQWTLVGRLGAGGHGEAWLVRHDKTRETRVYKFALDNRSLASLKREITLYRLLHDALPERRDYVEVLDWNLEEPPCWLELEHAGLSLVQWAQQRGGLAQVPLAARLEIVAQTAEALGAAHSVGVLHKDLKPGNVLIEGAGTAADPIRIKLADFGAGGVLDPERLKSLGITRLGFTQALHTGNELGGTALYVAPEVLRGQPATVQADVYALGVMLYQLVTGDLQRALAPGWEQEIEDELLRDDIAQAADGNPARRLTDANALAERLRSLAARREQRDADRASQNELNRQRRALVKSRARRKQLQIIVAVMLAGLVTIGALYWRAEQARSDAEKAAAITAAVNEFLNKDLLASANPWTRASKDLTVREVLAEAGAQVDRRFADRPEVAAQIHATLGETYAWLGNSEAARRHLEQAVAMFEQLYGAGSSRRLAALSDLSRTLANMGRIEEGCAAADRLWQDVSRLDPASRPALLAQLMRGRCLTLRGEFAPAIAALRSLLDRLGKAARPDAAILDEARLWIVWATMQAADYGTAEALEREILAALAREHGEHSVRTALQRFFLGLLLTETERHADAERELRQAIGDVRAGVGYGFDHRAPFDALLALALLEQGRIGDAIALLDRGHAQFVAHYGPAHPNGTVFRYLLGEAYKRQGRLDAAIETLRAALAAPAPIQTQLMLIGLEATYARVTLADTLRLRGRLEDARRELAAITPQQLAPLADRHPILAELRRVEGLIAIADRRTADARAALDEARRIHEQRFGAAHWRTKRAQAELAMLDR